MLIATSPSPLWDRIAHTFVPGDEFGSVSHLSEMNKKETLRLGQAAGFQYVDYFPFMWVPIGLVPYFKIRVNANAAWDLDRLIKKIEILNCNFVNQCIVLKK